MLRTVIVNPGEKEYDRITKELLPRFFPKEELAPQNITDDLIPYICFYDDDVFIGFGQLFKKPDLQYLRYMAMMEEFRSKGYGGKMLDMIIAQRGSVPLAGDIEPLDKNAPNYEQRVRRLRFYMEHNLVDTGYDFVFGGNHFSILSTGEESVPGIMQKYCAEYDRYEPGYIQIVKRPE